MGRTVALVLVYLFGRLHSTTISRFSMLYCDRKVEGLCSVMFMAHVRVKIVSCLVMEGIPASCSGAAKLASRVFEVVLT